MVTSLFVVLGGRANISAFADNNPSNEYTTTINKSNGLRVSDNNETKYVFKLHDNSDELGFFYITKPEWTKFNLDGDYSDCLFSWSNPNGTSSYFSVDLVVREETTYNKALIDGKYYNTRGFPGAYRITTVYKESSPGLNFKTIPDYGWTLKSKEQDGDLITAVAEKNPSGSYYDAMDWCLWEVGTIYIKSITIEYTCGD